MRLGWAIAVLLALAPESLLAQPAPKRLSQWLLEQPPSPDPYPFGLSWRVPGEEPAQQLLKHELLQDLAADPALGRLRAWIASLPVTGRVAVANPDPRWLAVRPARDPVLAPGQSVVLPQRPRTVVVIDERGERCAVNHASGREAKAYVEACSRAAVDWVWIVQPDGRVERYGVAPWNREAQDEPAPGAWIFAPSRSQNLSNKTAERLATFLATQGPAPDASGIALAPSAASAFSLRSRSAAVSANDWGEIGLLQTPTARMHAAGTLSVNASHVWPYTRVNVFAQPFDWLEAGFRYTDVSNRVYGTAGSTQTFKDKSFDAKLRLWRESAYVPEIALGARDIAGTGLFSGEYLVGAKRFGAFDAHLGLGWGYLAGRARQVDVGQGGTFSVKTYFSGPPKLFGGVQYQTPWQPLTVKLEHEGNDYRNEPLDNNLPQRSAWNVGLNYRIGRAVDLSAGVERGNRLMLGLAIHERLDQLFVPKSFDPPRVPYALRPEKAPDWSATVREIAVQTGWRVGKIEQAGRDLRVTLLDAEAGYWAERVDRAAAVLNRDAPPEIDRFTLAYRTRGAVLAEHVIDRDTWAAEQTQPIPPHERLPAVIARAPQKAPDGLVVQQEKRPRLEAGLGPDIVYTLGGPDAFALYQISAAERVRLWLRDDTWVRGKLRLRLIDNYDRFKFTARSNLPRVRTFAREYLTTSRVNLANLQVTHMGRLSEKQYYSAYAGYFEEMFGGVGGEWLYRPFAGRNAFGIDLNYVKQRDFEQDFGFRDYKVATGHATLYLDTGWNDVLATLSAGRYLAGDKGVTAQLSRVFRNGVTVGAFATKTNVSAEQFGEGSFDKGVFISIPLDAMLTKSVPGSAQILWRPLTRDGGAKLFRYDTLYDMTGVRSDRTLWYQPAAKKDDFDIAPRGAEPYLRAPPRPAESGWSGDPGYRHALAQALAAQGFRDVAVDYDGRRLSVRASHEELRPPERAIGRAARTALAHAPLETREIYVTLLEGANPLARYEFLDTLMLERFFSGRASAAELAPLVAIRYADETRRPADPLPMLADLSAVSEAPSLPAAVRESIPVRAVERTAADTFFATRQLPQVDWLRTGIAAAGLVVASRALDDRVFDAAKRHKSSRWVRGLVSTGDAIPLLAMGAAGLVALDGSDPVRQRTAFSAGEAGSAAFIAATGLKSVIHRKRPEGGSGSFPSRHAAVAWAAATPFALEYDSYWPYALAGITTLGRAASREHWLSDSVAGSLIGYGLGRFLWQANRERHKDAPRFMLGAEGIAVSWDLR